MKAQVILDSEVSPQVIIITETGQERSLMTDFKEGIYEMFRRETFSERKGGYMMSSQREEKEFAFRMIMNGTAGELKTQEAQLKVAMAIIDDYLNAGNKADREEVSKSAIPLYEEYFRREYVNKNDRI